MSALKEDQDNINESSIDIIDTVLKLATESEIFDEIPLLGSLNKIGKAASSISNILFLRQLERFMRSTNEKTTQDQRIKFAEKLKSQPRKLEEFYEQLLLRIDKIDDITKPFIFSKIYVSLISERILEDDFQGLCHALISSRLGDLVQFSKSFWTESYKHAMPDVPENVARNLISSGLVKFNVFETERQARFGVPAPIPRMSSPFEASRPPYAINFSITELGCLYAYISENLEGYFQRKSPELVKLGQSFYEFTKIQDESLRRAVREKWNLQD